MADADEVLLKRVRRGDPDALATFIEIRQQQLLAFIQRNMSATLLRKLDPHDVLQEVTLSALNSLEDMNLDDRDIFGWLCQLAQRRIIDSHRRHVAAEKRSAKREVGLGSPAADSRRGGLIDLLVASMTSPSGAFSRGQREFYLLEALNALSEESREAIRLRYANGLPTKEVAARLGKSDGAVRVLLSRSLSRLQSVLAQNSAFRSFQLPAGDADDNPKLSS